MERIISINDMTLLLNIDRRTLWVWHAKKGIFPAPIKNSGRAIGWPESTFENWLADKKAEAGRC